MNLPNKITLVRIAMIPFFVVAFYIDFPYHYLVATLIFALASFTDFLDGYIARKYNLVTDLGKFLDPIADKVLVLTGLVVMLADPSRYNSFYINGLTLILGGVGVSIIIAREMAVSSLRMMSAKKGVVLAADKLGKLKTVVTDIAIVVLMLSSANTDITSHTGYLINLIGLFLFALSVILTVVSGVSYLVKNKHVFKD